MSCNDKKGKFDSHCVCDVVKFINELQDAVTDTCPTGCDTPFLGANTAAPFANTRPFVLYTKSGDLFLPSNCFKFAGDFFTISPFLRVESVDDCCAVLRVLTPVAEDHDDDCHSRGSKHSLQEEARELICAFTNGLHNGHKTIPVNLEASNSCITVDLNCFCAIQCLRDTRVRGV
ncbi:CotY/CotZ family spore coat protein [Bacillus sp. 165]|uniref:CotY/CotZ family spore coat protein n=1 Tax=Bacillus sp. 165 TaxID=1529117 RepID=UPI001ADC7992|nr:CotY/CotZ family spore coat protein [Bacillus sp. 165]MBO9128625.1 spore coat protein [Bacillus sp. 165]